MECLLKMPKCIWNDPMMYTIGLANSSTPCLSIPGFLCPGISHTTKSKVVWRSHTLRLEEEGLPNMFHAIDLSLTHTVGRAGYTRLSIVHNASCKKRPQFIAEE